MNHLSQAFFNTGRRKTKTQGKNLSQKLKEKLNLRDTCKNLGNMRALWKRSDVDAVRVICFMVYCWSKCQITRDQRDPKWSPPCVIPPVVKLVPEKVDHCISLRSQGDWLRTQESRKEAVLRTFSTVIKRNLRFWITTTASTVLDEASGWRRLFDFLPSEEDVLRKLKRYVTVFFFRWFFGNSKQMLAEILS